MKLQCGNRSAKVEASALVPTPASLRAKLVPPLPPSHHLQPSTATAPKPASSQPKPAREAQSDRERQALRESYMEREHQGKREVHASYHQAHRKEQMQDRSSAAAPPRLEKENELQRREERQQHQGMGPPASRSRWSSIQRTRVSLGSTSMLLQTSSNLKPSRNPRA